MVFVIKTRGVPAAHLLLQMCDVKQFVPTVPILFFFLFLILLFLLFQYFFYYVIRRIIEIESHAPHRNPPKIINCLTLTFSNPFAFGAKRLSKFSTFSHASLSLFFLSYSIISSSSSSSHYKQPHILLLSHYRERHTWGVVFSPALASPRRESVERLSTRLLPLPLTK